MTPGQRIKHLRIERGLSLEQAAALTGGQLAHSTWSRIENGVSEDPHPQKKAAIAEALHCKVSDIWQRPAHSLTHVMLTLAGVKDGADYIERHGTREEEHMYAVRYMAMLELVDPGTRDEDKNDGTFDEHWQLASSLLFDAEAMTPLVVADPDGNVHREYDHLTPTTQRRVGNAKRERIHARGARAKAHAVASPTVPTRRRPRERRDSTRSSSSSSDDPGGESDRALGRRTNDRQGR